MRRLIGALCYVSFIATAIATLAGNKVHQPNSEAKDSACVAYHSEVAEQDTATENKKAASLIVVTSSGCPPCQRMKSTTIPELQEQGYKVFAMDYTDWPGQEVISVPALFYFDSQANVIRKEIGYRTARQVKRYLGK